MPFNHPQTTPPTQSVEKLSSRKLAPGTKKVGDHCSLEGKSVSNLGQLVLINWYFLLGQLSLHLVQMTLIISASQQGRQTHRVKTNLRCFPLFPLVPPTGTDALVMGTSFQSPAPSTSLKDYGERLFLQWMGSALPFSYWKFSVVVVSLT